MKKIFLFLVICILFVSCRKSGYDTGYEIAEYEFSNEFKTDTLTIKTPIDAKFINYGEYFACETKTNHFEKFYINDVCYYEIRNILYVKKLQTIETVLVENQK